MTFRSILVPTDFSPEAAAALTMASNLARAFDAKLSLLHVYAAPGFLMPDGFVAAPPSALRDLLEAIEKSLAELRARPEVAGLTVDAQAVQGTPAHDICQHARDAGHDLIVIGTHGRTGVSRLLLGSVAERVVREAPARCWSCAPRTPDADADADAGAGGARRRWPTQGVRRMAGQRASPLERRVLDLGA